MINVNRQKFRNIIQKQNRNHSVKILTKQNKTNKNKKSNHTLRKRTQNQTKQNLKHLNILQQLNDEYLNIFIPIY